MFYRGYGDGPDGREMGPKRQRMIDQGPPGPFYGPHPSSGFMYNPYGFVAPPPPPPFPAVRLRGLPFDCAELDVVEFFHGLDVVDVLFVHRNNKVTGEAFCVLGYPLQVDFALQKNRQNMGRRYVEVFRSTKQEYYKAIANEVAESRVHGMASGGGGGLGGGNGSGYQQHHPQLHQYGSYQQHQHQQHKAIDRGSGDDVKTLWVGDLLHWMDETYLHSCFSHTGEVSSVKVIRNKLTSQSEGYGFVEFLSRAAAEEVLQNYSGSVMPNSDQPFRINWASFSTGEKRAVENGPDLSVFVGDLSPDVTDVLLHETFSDRYPSVKSAKVVIDSNTGRSKGYGFVRFGDENERSRALTEMNGAYCSNRQMRVGIATPKRAIANQQQHSSQAVILAGGHGSNGSMGYGSQSDGESTNATIFVGGIDPDVIDEDLRQPFSQFGEVVSVKIPVGKGCGFVQFADRKSAEDAIESLNGTVIGKNTVRLSWGRSPNKQWRGDSGQQWNGGYSRGHGYNNGGGYANHHDSNNYHGEN